MDEMQLELGLSGFGGPQRARAEPVGEPPVEGTADPELEVAKVRAEEVWERLKEFGAPVQRVVLTENRRTMLSWTGRERGILRIHRRFAAADLRVIRAVADYVTLRGGARRAAATRTIREFVQGFPAIAAEPRRRRIALQDRAHVERLSAEFARVNERHFEGKLPVVPILLSARMRRRNGHFSTRPLEIVISRSLCVHAESGEAEHTLRHEMIHLWQHVAGVRIGHGPEFRQWARALDVHPRATRGVMWKEKRRK